MNELKTDKGVIKYRNPNAMECFDIISCIFDEEGKVREHMQIKKKIAQFACDNLMDISGTEYKDKEEMIGDIEMHKPISSIADDIYLKFNDAYMKKKE